MTRRPTSPEIPMKRALPATVLGLLALSLATSAALRRAAGPAPVVLGTFDSRAVALAYYRSDLHKAHLAKMKKQMGYAQETNNKKRIARIEEEMRRSQELAHRQTFGTASVSGLIAELGGAAGIADMRGVDCIVSKWDLVHCADEAKLVDVTDAFVELIGADASTRGLIEDIRGREPLSEDELSEE